MSFRVPPALRHRRFRLLWLGLLISIAGSQMQLWALFWHIRTLTNQPIAVSGIGAVRFLPILFFSLFGGLVADLYDRRKVMFISQTVMALTALGLGVLTMLGVINLGQIYLLTAIQAVASAFDLPARQSLVPNLVPGEDLTNAFSVQSIAFELGSIVGPALSGLVIGYLGQQYAYLINALSYVAVLVALFMIGPVAQVAPRAAQRGGSATAMNLESIKEGIRFIVHAPLIMGSMLLDFFATFFSSANTLLPFVARDILHVNAVAYGWLSAAQSIGAVGASLVITQVKEIRRQGPLLLLGIFLFGVATVLFGMARQYSVTFVALILVGTGDSLSTVIRNTIRQLQTPDYIRGRMTSINQIFFMGGPQLGEIEAGLAAQAFGTPIAIITGGVGCLLAVALVAWRWPQIRRYNGDEPILAGAPAD